jgi:hypothetical protein
MIHGRLCACWEVICCFLWLILYYKWTIETFNLFHFPLFDIFFYFYFFNFIWKLSYLKLCNPVSLNILCIWFAGMVLLMFGKCLLICSTTSHWQHWLVCYYVILERTIGFCFCFLLELLLVCWLECHHFQLHVFWVFVIKILKASF